MLIDPSLIVRKTACGVIFNDKRQILLIMRNDMPLWESVGGGVDEGETHEQAVIRETKEEIGVDATIKRLIGTFYRRINDLAETGYRHFKLFELEADVSKIVLDEHIDSQWFSMDALPENTAPLHILCFRYADAGRENVEEITELNNGREHMKTLSVDRIYGLDLWNKHPKVVAKRAAGEMRFDPFPV